jgi:hypothetical protein
LSVREAAILMAATGVVIPCCEGDPSMLATIVRNVDRYLGTLPPRLLRRVRLAVLVFEQTTAVTLGSDRFTRLPWIERDRYLRALEAGGGRLAQVARAVRDLCLVGYYQAPETFAALGYEGPVRNHQSGPSSQSPDPLRAPSGHLPRSVAG